MLPWVLMACSGQQVRQYADQKPAFDAVKYFQGNVEGNGIFQDRHGKVLRRFKVQTQGVQQGDSLVLHEVFDNLDGTHPTRTWLLRSVHPGELTGYAADVVGVATGQMAGNALHWNYVLDLPVHGHTLPVRMDDWMYAIDAEHVLNVTRMSFWGWTLGHVTLAFSKHMGEQHVSSLK
ncbi:MAG: DUF3833 family protein [Pseudomonadales bacterium]|nr:DUF3833 family protein [Pseudomonadales bacterium]